MLMTNAITLITVGLTFLSLTVRADAPTTEEGLADEACAPAIDEARRAYPEYVEAHAAHVRHVRSQLRPALEFWAERVRTDAELRRLLSAGHDSEDSELWPSLPERYFGIESSNEIERCSNEVVVRHSTAKGEIYACILRQIPFENPVLRIASGIELSTGVQNHENRFSVDARGKIHEPNSFASPLSRDEFVERYVAATFMERREAYDRIEENELNHRCVHAARRSNLREWSTQFGPHVEWLCRDVTERISSEVNETRRRLNQEIQEWRGSVGRLSSELQRDYRTKPWLRTYLQRYLEFGLEAQHISDLLENEVPRTAETEARLEMILSMQDSVLEQYEDRLVNTRSMLAFHALEDSTRVSFLRDECRVHGSYPIVRIVRPSEYTREISLIGCRDSRTGLLYEDSDDYEGSQWRIERTESGDFSVRACKPFGGAPHCAVISPRSGSPTFETPTPNNEALLEQTLRRLSEGDLKSEDLTTLRMCHAAVQRGHEFGATLRQAISQSSEIQIGEVSGSEGLKPSRPGAAVRAQH